MSNMLHVRISYKDGETTSWFDGYVFHIYYNVDAKTAKILNAGFEEDEFTGVTALSIDDGMYKVGPIYPIAEEGDEESPHV